MKKKWLIGLTAFAMAVTMSFGLAACGEEEIPEEGKSDAEIVQAAISTLRVLYADQAVDTPSSYTVLGQTRVGDVTCVVDWTVSSSFEGYEQYVSIGSMDDTTKQITINVRKATEVIEYTLKGTINVGEASDSIEFNRRIPAGADHGDAEIQSATLSFATSDARQSLSTQEQVWAANGITFTSKKGGGSDIIESEGHIRLYQGSIARIEYPGIVRVDFHCSSSNYDDDYVTYLQATLETIGLPDATITVSAESLLVSLDLATPVDYLEFTPGKQIRLTSIDVDGIVGGASDEDKVTVAKAMLTLAQTEYAETATVELPTTSYGASIAWALKTASEYATVESNTLTISQLPEEDAEITLVATITSGTASDTKEIAVTLKPSLGLEHTGEADSPFTTQEALDIIASLASDAYYMKNGAEAKVYVTGYVVATGEWKDKYGNYEGVYIAGSPEGTQTSEDAILTYRLTPDGTLVKAGDTLTLGASITVCGYLQNFRGDTPEITYHGDNPEIVAYELPSHVHTYEYVPGTWTHRTNCAEGSGCDLSEPLTAGCVPELNICSKCHHEYSAADIVAALYKLETGKSLAGTYKLTGVVKSAEAYSSEFGNVTFVITVEGKDVTAFRATSEEFAEVVKVGDTVTVTGSLTNYQGKCEFNSGCVIIALTEGEGGDEPELPPLPEGQVRESVTIAEYADEQAWENSQQYGTIEIGEHITVTATGTGVGDYGSNTGKYYTNGENWRIYQNEHPSITFTAGAGYTIISVKITYVSNKTGILKSATTDATYESDAVIEVNAASISFTVGNTDASVSNGQVQITAIEVIYKSEGTAQEKTDEDKVQEVLKGLKITPDTFDAVGDDADLPTTNSYGAQVAWTVADHTDLVQIEGGNTLKVIKLPEETATVKLHAVVTLNSAKAEGDVTITVQAEDKTNYGTEDAPLSVAQALALAEEQCTAAGDFTKEIVYATGIAVNTASAKGTYYENLTIKDLNGDEKILIYTMNLDSGVAAPAQNDTIVLYGYIKNHYDTIEFAGNGSTYVRIQKNERGDSTITLGDHDGATVTGLPQDGKAKNGSEVTFTVSAQEKKEVTSVKINGVKQTPSEGTTYKFTVAGNAEIVVETKDQGAADATVLATFDLGAKGTAEHKDGSGATTYSETNGSYTLSVSGGENFYTNAYDATGNSCFKLGTSKKTGSFSLTAPADITKVVIYIAGYKASAGAVKINGAAEQSIPTFSNNGAYTAVEVDTSATKAVTVETGSVCRCMVDKIEFWGIAGGGTVEPQPEPTETTSVKFDFSFNATPDTTVLDDASAKTYFMTAGSSPAELTDVSGVAYIFKGHDGNGGPSATPGSLKMGNSKNSGKMTLTFSKQVTKVVVNWISWSSSKGKLTVGGVACAGFHTEASDEEFVLASPTSTLAIASTERVLITSITVYLAG